MPPEPEAGTPMVSLHDAWPPASVESTRGYRPIALSDTTLLATLDLGPSRVVAVAGRADGSRTAVPFRFDGAWRVGNAADGLASALLVRSGTGSLSPGFDLVVYGSLPPLAGAERELGTDQSNISVVVDDRVIVKWRSAPDADGRRSTRLRRHLRANEFTRTPELVASLTWTGHDGEPWILADIDRYLPDAEDGWDHSIEVLRRALDSTSGPIEPDLGRALGALTGELHAALLHDSPVIPRPTRMAHPPELRAVRDAGLELLERALRVEAVDQHEVTARDSLLRHAISAAPSDATLLGPTHGDLHIGQVVAWRDGLDVIDFDGAPEPTEPTGPVDSPVRDVAQMVCSLWSLAAVVDARSDSVHASRLRAWAEAAERDFLATYADRTSAGGLPPYDARLYEPFIAEQLCRELLYADATLPRWRYAPLQALCWRFPLEAR